MVPGPGQYSRDRDNYSRDRDNYSRDRDNYARDRDGGRGGYPGRDRDGPRGPPQRDGYGRRDYPQSPRDGPRGPRGPSGYSRDAPAPITSPTPCKLAVNLFRYTGRSLTMFRYAVTFNPEPRRAVMFECFARLASQNNFSEPYAFDGNSTLVTLKKIPDTEFRSPMRDGELVCRIEYKMTLSSDSLSKPHSGSDGNSELVLNTLEVLYKHYQRSKFFVHRRNFFEPLAKGESIGAGVDVNRGLTASLVYTSLGLALNLDVAYTAFYRSQPLVDLLRELGDCGRSRPSSGGYSSGPPGRRTGDSSLEFDASFYDNFERVLRTLRLRTNHRERSMTFKPSGLLRRSASECEFEVLEAGNESAARKVTVADYFAETYGKRLRYPHLPLVVVRRRDRELYMPMEVLDVAPMQKLARKLDETECAAMIRLAATKPAERFRLIETKAGELAALQNDTLRQFGMCFDARLMNCHGTVLVPPALVYDRGKEIRPVRGSWNLAGGLAAVSGSDACDWKLFVFRERDRPSPRHLQDFAECAKLFGVTLGPMTEQSVRSVEDFYKAKKALLNIVVLPDRSAQRYEGIKRVAETYGKGCYTQCLLGQNVRKMADKSFVANLLLKINTKLGGKNWKLKERILDDKPTVLIGIDVEHPGAGDLRSPSIVGVVVSLDHDFVSYSTAVFEQQPKQEIVTSLRGVVKEMLRRHTSSTHVLPRRVIVFRDGVGSSMFEQVFASEIESIRGACHDLGLEVAAENLGHFEQPEINFVVAQKRHSVRFSDNGRNAQPGTVFEGLGSGAGFGLGSGTGFGVTGDSSSRVSPSTTPQAAASVHDFFLVSHAACQGTARPVRYIWLLNESKFNLQQAYGMVYDLCHLYMRATKAVSLVTPVYYAHLAAARGHCYLEESSAGGSSEGTGLTMRRALPLFEKALYFL